MPDEEKAKVVGQWLHSHEEDSGGQLVYRPASHDFPPARGRDGFELAPDGTLVDLGIAPTDGTSSMPGRWTLDDDVLNLEPESAHRRRALKLISAEPDKLVVERASLADEPATTS